MRNTTTIMNAKYRVGQSILVLALTGNRATDHDVDAQVSVSHLLTHRRELAVLSAAGKWRRRPG
jgi:hypothetical protein